MLSRHDFSYTYPKELIAKHPLKERDASRMMVLHRQTKTWEHRIIQELPHFLNAGDLLVFNDTKVFPARLFGKNNQEKTFEILLLNPLDDKKSWRCLGAPLKKIKVGDTLQFGSDFHGVVRAKTEGELILELSGEDVDAKIEGIGFPPLPPYLRRKTSKDYSKEDKERYQSIFAKQSGSAAAPTASLHFSETLLEALQKKGIETASITLHVSTDTFLPIRTEEIDQHKMHGEFFFVPEETKKKVLKAKEEKKRVLAIGTTVVRALESNGSKNVTDLYIQPGFSFQTTDSILTNFHQPESTLIVLAASFTGREFLLNAYKEAINQRYRLFSFGDCMLIL